MGGMSMKKVLLVGKFTEEFREMNKKLAEKYEVRASVNKLEIFKGMFKLNKPDAIVMFYNEINEDNEQIVGEIKKEYKNIPVVCAGIKYEEGKMSKALLSKQFEYMEEPYTVEELIEKVEYILKKDISEDESTENGGSEKSESQKEKNEGTEKDKAVTESVPESEAGKKSILLVDDSGMFLRMMKRLLEEEYNVDMTTSGLKAITMAKEKRPDLILLDYEMPLYDGRETMIKLRQSEQTKDIPIVFVTAVNDKEHIRSVLTLKPTAYLLKPIDKDRVFKTIKDILK